MTYIARCAELGNSQTTVGIRTSRHALLSTTKEILEVVAIASGLGAAARWLGLWCHPVGGILSSSSWSWAASLASDVLNVEHWLALEEVLVASAVLVLGALFVDTELNDILNLGEQLDRVLQPSGPVCS